MPAQKKEGRFDEEFYAKVRARLKHGGLGLLVLVGIVGYASSVLWAKDFKLLLVLIWGVPLLVACFCLQRLFNFPFQEEEETTFRDFKQLCKELVWKGFAQLTCQACRRKKERKQEETARNGEWETNGVDEEACKLYLQFLKLSTMMFCFLSAISFVGSSLAWGPRRTINQYMFWGESIVPIPNDQRYTIRAACKMVVFTLLESVIALFYAFKYEAAAQHVTQQTGDEVMSRTVWLTGIPCRDRETEMMYQFHPHELTSKNGVGKTLETAIWTKLCKEDDRYKLPWWASCWLINWFIPRFRVLVEELKADAREQSSPKSIHRLLSEGSGNSDDFPGEETTPIEKVVVQPVMTPYRTLVDAYNYILKLKELQAAHLEAYNKACQTEVQEITDTSSYCWKCLRPSVLWLCLLLPPILILFSYIAILYSFLFKLNFNFECPLACEVSNKWILGFAVTLAILVGWGLLIRCVRRVTCFHFMSLWWNRENYLLYREQHRIERAKFMKLDIVTLRLSGHAFITFNEDEPAEKMLKTRDNCCHFHTAFRIGRPPFSSMTLRCRRAPHPSDVNWENLQFGAKKKYLSFGVGLVLSTLLAGAVFLITLASPSARDEVSDGSRCEGCDECVEPSLNCIGALTSRTTWICCWQTTVEKIVPQEYSQVPSVLLVLLTSIVIPFVVEFLDKNVICYYLASSGQYFECLFNYVFMMLSKFWLPLVFLTIIPSTLDDDKSQRDVLTQLGKFYLQYTLTCIFISSPLTLSQFGRHLFCWPQWMLSRSESTRMDVRRPFPFAYGYWYAWSLSLATNAMLISVIIPSILPITAVFFWVKHKTDKELFELKAFAPGQDAKLTCPVIAVHHMTATISQKILLMALYIAFFSLRIQDGTCYPGKCEKWGLAILIGFLMLISLVLYVLGFQHMQKRWLDLQVGGSKKSSRTNLVVLVECLGKMLYEVCLLSNDSHDFLKQRRSNISEPLLPDGTNSRQRAETTSTFSSTRTQDEIHRNWDAREHMLKEGMKVFQPSKTQEDEALKNKLKELFDPAPLKKKERAQKNWRILFFIAAAHRFFEAAARREERRRVNSGKGDKGRERAKESEKEKERENAEDRALEKATSEVTAFRMDSQGLGNESNDEVDNKHTSKLAEEFHCVSTGELDSKHSSNLLEESHFVSTEKVDSKHGSDLFEGSGFLTPMHSFQAPESFLTPMNSFHAELAKDKRLNHEATESVAAAQGDAEEEKKKRR